MKKILSKALMILMAVIITLSSAPVSSFVGAELSSRVAITAQAATKKTHLNKTKKSIYIGRKYTLKLLDKNNKVISASKVKWKSSNTKLATVSQSGVVKGKKAGKVKITATYKKKTYTATITVKSTVSVNKTKLTFAAGSTSKKAVKVTFKDDCSVVWDIVKGEDLITCKWTKKDWDGDTTTLYITPTGDGFGSARVKIYSEDYPNSYAYVDVEIKSPYTLKVKNKLPCYVSNYEASDYYDKGEKESTVKINKVKYEVLYGDSISITVDFEAYESYYTEGYYYIKYRVLDEDGYVVEFDRIMSERMFVGDKARETITLWDLEPGKYTIEFLDHYANA